jgi:two-component system sensor histidine kinase UhpB
MRSRTLLTQVLAVNTLLVVATAVVAAAVADQRVQDVASGRGLLLLALCVFCVILLNSLLLRRRLAPIEELVARMDAAELGGPGSDGVSGAPPERRASREVQELTERFDVMLHRLADERRKVGSAVLRAQEQERQRLARNLHDEVNQALTGILLRLQATIGDAPEPLRAELQETKGLVNHAMEELLRLARQLRPTALDDHGLLAALEGQVSDFGQLTGIETRFVPEGPAVVLSDEQQLVVYRVAQESLSNIARHADAHHVEVVLSFANRTMLRVSDDGRGFAPQIGQDGSPQGRPGGLGLSGMRERAMLAGGRFSVFSSQGRGTTIELILE